VRRRRGDRSVRFGRLRRRSRRGLRARRDQLSLEHRIGLGCGRTLGRLSIVDAPTQTYASHIDRRHSYHSSLSKKRTLFFPRISDEWHQKSAISGSMADEGGPNVEWPTIVAKTLTGRRNRWTRTG
jgi:hypothetical protein